MIMQGYTGLYRVIIDIYNLSTYMSYTIHTFIQHISTIIIIPTALKIANFSDPSPGVKRSSVRSEFKPAVARATLERDRRIIHSEICLKINEIF